MNIKLFKSSIILLYVCLYVNGGLGDWSDFNIYFKKLWWTLKLLWLYIMNDLKVTFIFQVCILDNHPVIHNPFNFVHRRMNAFMYKI